MDIQQIRVFGRLIIVFNYITDDHKFRTGTCNYFDKLVAMPGVAKPVENFPDDIVEKMIVNDFAWAAANRMRLLAEWQKRYDSKSDPKD